MRLEAGGHHERAPAQGDNERRSTRRPLAACLNRSRRRTNVAKGASSPIRRVVSHRLQSVDSGPSFSRHWEFTGPRGYKPGFSEISLINSLSSRRTCCARLITNGALLKEVLHWSPICFDPSARMTVKSVRRYADLSEAKFRPNFHLAQFERGD